MSEIVPADQIEQIVGAKRHPTEHIARLVSAEKRVYILHSETCLRYHDDLRDCRYSKALDHGIDAQRWESREDQPVAVIVLSNQLIPAAAPRQRGIEHLTGDTDD